MYYFIFCFYIVYLNFFEIFEVDYEFYYFDLLNVCCIRNDWESGLICIEEWVFNVLE